MLKTNGELQIGRCYNQTEINAWRLITDGFAVEETKPTGPSEIKPAEPSEIKAKKKLSRARMARES